MRRTVHPSCHRPLSRTLFALLALSASTAQAQSMIDAPFTSDQAQGWTLLSSARMTAALPAATAPGAANDPANAGWLELTPNAQGQVGAAVFNTPISSLAGMRIAFDYAMYEDLTHGGVNSPNFVGDGLTLFLTEGTAAPSVGGGGMGLGYAVGDATGANNPNGVTGGYLGLGLDRFGAFSNAPTAGDPSAGYVTLRGSDVLPTRFKHIARSQALSLASLRTAPKQVQITITAAPNISVLASIDGVQVLSWDLVVAGVPIAGMAATPDSFKLGLSAGTGAADQSHQIRNLVVSSLTPVTPVDDNFVVTGVLNDSVRSNDSNPFSAAEHTVLTAPPAAQGQLALNADGSFSFSPASGFTGTSFSYQVCAGPAGTLPCAQAQVALSLASPSAPGIAPVTVGDASASFALTPPATLPLGTTVMSYDLSCASPAGSVQALGVGPSANLNGLTNGTAYSCTATANLSNQTASPVSAAVTVTPTASPQALVPVPTLGTAALAMLGLLMSSLGVRRRRA